MDRITVIHKSVTAFICGIIGCVPFIGLVPAIYALVTSVKVHRCFRDWNPASTYLNWGGVLGGLGIVISELVAFAIGFAMIS